MRILSFSLSMLLLSAGAQLQAQSDTTKGIAVGPDTWTQTNLSVSKFRNGEDIPEAKTAADFEKAKRAKKAAWCYYDYEAENGVKYGKLYNWYAVTDPRGLAPAGWHVASNEEWETLKKTVSPDSYDAGRHLKSKGWKNGTSITRKSGFEAVPAGIANWGGDFHNKKTFAYFWTSSPQPAALEAWHIEIYGWKDQVELVKNLDMGCGMSVRCVKDKH